jgi:hypothetical protein
MRQCSECAFRICREVTNRRGSEQRDWMLVTRVVEFLPFRFDSVRDAYGEARER